MVETVSNAWGTTDLVLLPLHEGQLGETTLLRTCIREAIDLVPARIVALAGMLPSLTGLGAEALSERNVVLTTGHAATVVAMFKTVQTVLNATKKAWNELQIGVLGFGAIGQATLQLCVAKLGKPHAVSIADPRFGTSVSSLLECDLILGATSTGLVLDVDQLKPGTIVIDDSLPRPLMMKSLAAHGALSRCPVAGRRNVGCRTFGTDVSSSTSRSDSIQIPHTMASRMPCRSSFIDCQSRTWTNGGPCGSSSLAPSLGSRGCAWMESRPFASRAQRSESSEVLCKL